jgi:hypothetical protein
MTNREETAPPKSNTTLVAAHFPIGQPSRVDPVLEALLRILSRRLARSDHRLFVAQSSTSRTMKTSPQLHNATKIHEG